VATYNITTTKDLHSFELNLMFPAECLQL